MGLFLDMVPDWNWAKRGGVERDGSALTPRRAAILYYTLLMRLCLFLSLVPILNFMDHFAMQAYSDMPIAFPVIWFAALAICIIGDWDRILAINAQFQPNLIETEQWVRIAFPLAFLAYLSIIALAIWGPPAIKSIVGYMLAVPIFWLGLVFYVWVKREAALKHP